MLRTCMFLAAASVAAADYSDFTTSLVVYQNPGCAGSPVQSYVASSLCQPVGQVPATLFAIVGACNFDNQQPGVTFYRDAACQNALPGFPSTYIISQCTNFTTAVSFAAQCTSAPGSTTTGIIVSFAVILSVGTAGLCVYWVYTDFLFKKKTKQDRIDMETSVAAEKAKVEGTSGFTFAATVPSAGGSGYAALH